MSIFEPGPKHLFYIFINSIEDTLIFGRKGGEKKFFFRSFLSFCDDRRERASQIKKICEKKNITTKRNKISKRSSELVKLNKQNILSKQNTSMN